MTIIAYRDGVMAADTEHTIGYAKHHGAEKIAIGPNGTLAGTAGDHGACTAFLEWVRRGDPGEAPPIPTPRDDGDGSSFVAIVVTPAGVIRFLSHGGFSVVGADYFAIGAGAEVALGAMHAGASACGAVSAAIEHAKGCGGEVRSLPAVTNGD